MDTRNGRIYSAETALAMLAAAGASAKYLKPMVADPTPVQLARGRVGRNDPCPCGSGRKFKRCCLAASDADARAACRQRAVEEAERSKLTEMTRETHRRGGLIQFSIKVLVSEHAEEASNG